MRREQSFSAPATRAAGLTVGAKQVAHDVRGASTSDAREGDFQARVVRQSSQIYPRGLAACPLLGFGVASDTVLDPDFSVGLPLVFIRGRRWSPAELENKIRAKRPLGYVAHVALMRAVSIFLVDSCCVVIGGYLAWKYLHAMRDSHEGLRRWINFGKAPRQHAALAENPGCRTSLKCDPTYSHAERTGNRPRLERYCVNSGRPGALRSCPAGSSAEVGLRWCGGRAAAYRMEDLNVRNPPRSALCSNLSRRRHKAGAAEPKRAQATKPIRTRSNRASLQCFDRRRVPRSPR